MRSGLKPIRLTFLILLSITLSIFCFACASPSSDTLSQQPPVSDTGVSDSDNTDGNGEKPENPAPDDGETEEPSAPENPGDTETEKPTEEKCIFEGDWYGFLYDMMYNLYEIRIVIDEKGVLGADSFFAHTNMLDNERTQTPISIETSESEIEVVYDGGANSFMLNSERDEIISENFAISVAEDSVLSFALTTDPVLPFEELNTILTGRYADETESYVFEYADMFGTLELSDGELYETAYINNNAIILSDSTLMDNAVTLIFESGKLYFGKTELTKID